MILFCYSVRSDFFRFCVNDADADAALVEYVGLSVWVVECDARLMTVSRVAHITVARAID